MIQAFLSHISYSPEGYLEHLSTLFGIQSQNIRDDFTQRINQLISREGFLPQVPDFRFSDHRSSGIVWTGNEFLCATFIDYTLPGYTQLYTAKGIYIFDTHSHVLKKIIPVSSQVQMIGNGESTQGIILARYFPFNLGIEFLSADFSQSYGQFSEYMISDIPGYDFVGKRANTYFHIKTSQGRYTEENIGEPINQEGYYPYFLSQGQCFTLYMSRLDRGKKVVESNK